MNKCIQRIAASFLICEAFLLRCFLAWNNWPLPNGDEGTMGIMAIHIVHGARPIFFYGQNYMGALEAYAGALFFHFFGVSVFSLRLGPILFFTLFMICVYILISKIYNEYFALFTLLVLSLGSNAVLSRQLMALGGYMETLFFTSLLFLLTYQLALCPSNKHNSKRLLIYGCSGLVIGLGLWCDLLILPWLMCTGIMLFLFCRKEILRGASIFLLSGVIVGATPLIIYNSSAAPDQTSWALFMSQQGSVPLTFPVLLQQIKGTLAISIPTITGSPFCHVDEFSDLKLLGFEPSSTPTLPCHIIGISWSLIYVLLFLVSLYFIMKSLKKTWQAYPLRAWVSKERPAAAKQTLQLLVFVGALFTIIPYIHSYAPLKEPAEYSRYLICLWMTTPFVLWPLWRGVAKTFYKAENKSLFILKIQPWLYVSLLLTILTIFLYGTGRTIIELPLARTADAQESQLIHTLLEKRITHVYTDYWTCDRLAFQSQERIVCAVLAGGCSLQRGSHNRYTPYYTTVSRDPGAAYLLHTSNNCAQAVALKMRQKGKTYRTFLLNEYTVYQVL